MLFPSQVTLKQLELLHFVTQDLPLVITEPVFLAKELFEVCLIRLGSFQQHDFCLAKVYYVLFKCIYQYLKVAVLSTFCKREEQTLSDVILAEEVATGVSCFFCIYKRILGWEKISGKRLVVISLWWVNHLRDHYGLLGLIISEPTEECILVDKSQLSACWVHVYLVDEKVCNFRVLYHRNTQERHSNDHSR